MEDCRSWVLSLNPWQMLQRVYLRTWMKLQVGSLGWLLVPGCLQTQPCIAWVGPYWNSWRLGSYCLSSLALVHFALASLGHPQIGSPSGHANQAYCSEEHQVVAVSRGAKGRWRLLLNFVGLGRCPGQSSFGGSAPAFWLAGAAFVGYLSVAAGAGRAVSCLCAVGACIGTPIGAQRCFGGSGCRQSCVIGQPRIGCPRCRCGLGLRGHQTRWAWLSNLHLHCWRALRCLQTLSGSRHMDFGCYQTSLLLDSGCPLCQANFGREDHLDHSELATDLNMRHYQVGLQHDFLQFAQAGSCAVVKRLDLVRGHGFGWPAQEDLLSNSEASIWPTRPSTDHQAGSEPKGSIADTRRRVTELGFGIGLSIAGIVELTCLLMTFQRCRTRLRLPLRTGLSSFAGTAAARDSHRLRLLGMAGLHSLQRQASARILHLLLLVRLLPTGDCWSQWLVHIGRTDPGQPFLAQSCCMPCHRLLSGLWHHRPAAIDLGCPQYFGSFWIRLDPC